MTIEITVHESVSEISPEIWDACACPEAESGAGRPLDPFTTHRFLSALERSGSVGPGSGWWPRPLVARAGSEVIAVAPTYLKDHSQGEYIFDHAWADAYMRAGGRYYPKLQCAVPFTPATGRRFLTRPGHEETGRAALLEGMQELARQNALSGVHATFCTEAEASLAEAAGYLARHGQQFHWENRGYASHDDFLADLSSRKRKALRKERARAQDFGGEIVALTGADLAPEHWAAMWTFYCETGARKWGRPYLTRAFFDLAADQLADDALMVLARRDGRWVAGALNFIGRDTLYGRYWGALEDHPFLHFELCYHQAIDWAIAQGLQRVEAGAQGEHKLARGYMPVAVHSVHWLRDPGFQRAVDQYLHAERRALADEIEILTAWGPFRRGPAVTPPEERD
ncbi:GNAT family N-acetyltransferase [Phaeovulum vinaykumarii]|uniref:Uncharacterized protein n=1 Tax=Phaeovulum vinaykumarii TaxID=407234 RepID=A0A1N7K7T9_9RHOB|nr:GNAT family N-acetyltransferase [Phaeovulum vinaykumarii]SIS57626.1 hypothetical protein SAMN05421795_101687 [Phaeovulum vinaykumarii]SOB93489.1 hypothetical protein SAMN05878426_101684 [Phaeovulum vinaykumarii]